MASFFSLISNLFLPFLFLFLISFSHTYGIHHPLCDDRDRSSLLRFKQSLFFDKFSCDPSINYTKLSSWNVSDDCCSWDGVNCDDQTGHVIGLSLSSSCLFGSINSSSPLFRLVHLKNLDLSSNNFNLSTIPYGISSLSELRHLDLSVSGFSGQIPSKILGNLLQLKFLSLSHNNFSSGTLHWLHKLTNLESLDLAETNSYGPIPASFQNLTQLEELRLSGNQLTGQIPSWLGNSTHLTNLVLFENELQGPIPDSIFQLPNIQVIDLSYNHLSGSLRYNSFLQSKYLWFLHLSINQLSLVSNTYINVTLPKFEILGLAVCNLSEFPSFLRGQNELEFLELAHNNIKGYVPNWISSLESLAYLGLTNNSLTGFEQPLSILSLSKLHKLEIKDNEFKGRLLIPPPSIAIYSASQNKFSGVVSPLFCNLTSLAELDLSSNNLSGNLPSCLGNNASVLILRNNSLSGEIPNQFTSGCSLKVMDFSQNLFEGKAPDSLANCSNLETSILRKIRLMMASLLGWVFFLNLGFCLSDGISFMVK